MSFRPGQATQQNLICKNKRRKRKRRSDVCEETEWVTITFSSIHSAPAEHLWPLNLFHPQAAYSASLINGTLISYVALVMPPNFSSPQYLQPSPVLEDTCLPRSRHTMDISSFLFASYPNVCRGRQAGPELPELNFCVTLGRWKRCQRLTYVSFCSDNPA